MSQDLQQKIAETAQNLWDLAKTVSTKEEAEQIRRQINAPLGILVSKFDVALPNNVSQSARKSEKEFRQIRRTNADFTNQTKL